MPDRMSKLLILAVLLVALACAAILLWPSPVPVPQPDSSLLSVSEDLDEYEYTLVFEPAERMLSVDMELRMQNRTGSTLKDVVLRTYAGAYQNMDSSPVATDEMFDQYYPNGFSSGGLQLDGVWWQGVPAGYAFDDYAQTALRISVPDFPDGGIGKLSLRMSLTVPECLGRYGTYRDTWCFGNSLPILALFSGGAWRTDPYVSIGDPFVSGCANYNVSLTLPQGYACSASVAMRPETGKSGGLVYKGQAYALRDFAFVISKGQIVAQAVTGGVLVSSYASTANEARTALGFAGKALETYAALYGKYSYPSLTLYAANLPFSGMEYPGMILLSNRLFTVDMRDSLELLIAHETAHQWFYALVGSDQFNQPWQDEALCEYSMLCYVRERYGEAAYENLRALRVEAPMRENIPEGITPGSPLDYFSNMDEYSSIVYGRGAAMLIALDTITGGILPFLQLYCKTFAFRVASREDFISLLNTWSGKDLTPLLIDYLDTSI